MTPKNWTPTIIHVEPSKKRVRLEAVDAFHILAAHHEPHRVHEQALHYARRLLELEPWLEGTTTLPRAPTPSGTSKLACGSCAAQGCR